MGKNHFCCLTFTFLGKSRTGNSAEPGKTAKQSKAQRQIRSLVFYSHFFPACENIGLADTAISPHLCSTPTEVSCPALPCPTGLLLHPKPPAPIKAFLLRLQRLDATIPCPCHAHVHRTTHVLSCAAEESRIMHGRPVPQPCPVPSE